MIRKGKFNKNVYPSINYRNMSVKTRNEKINKCQIVVFVLRIYKDSIILFFTYIFCVLSFRFKAYMSENLRMIGIRAENNELEKAKVINPLRVSSFLIVDLFLFRK